VVIEYNATVREIIIDKIKTFQRVLEEFPEIKYLGDPILRMKTETAGIKEGKQIGQRLGETLVRYRKLTGMGRGLAGPQIGLDKSVFVTFVDNNLQIYINPMITGRSNSSNYYRELCISSGIMGADVRRSEEITLEWTDENGNSHKQKFDGFMARLLQT